MYTHISLFFISLLFVVVLTPAIASLVSHYSAIGDTISCDAPCSAIGFRGKLFLRYPLVRSVLDCDRPFLQKEVGVWQR